MTDQERKPDVEWLAEWLHDQDKSYWHSNQQWDWQNESEVARKVWRDRAASLIALMVEHGWKPLEECEQDSTEVRKQTVEEISAEIAKYRYLWYAFTHEKQRIANFILDSILQSLKGRYSLGEEKIGIAHDH